MPITFEVRQWEFSELVNHIKETRPEIDSPEGFVKSLEDKQTAAIEQATAEILKNIKLTTATADFFTKDGKNFASFFLINGEENLKHWQVLPETIPKFVETFKDMPFISEPELGHFNMEQLELSEAVSKQEDFRIGNITEVTFDPKTSTANAIVEFANTPKAAEVWNDIQAGKAIYVSPAIAGFSVDTPTARVYTEWYGLHLARVSNPAYGVHHASLKRTCTGPDRECIMDLVSHASASTGNSFKCPFANSANMSNEQTDKEKIEELEKAKASLEKANLDLTKKLDKSAGQAEELKSISQEVTQLKDALKEKEEMEKVAIVDSIIEIEQELGIVSETDEDLTKEKEELNKLDSASLLATKAKLGKASANVKKSLESGSAKIVKMPPTPSTASASAGEKKPELDVRQTIQEMSNY